VPSLRLAVVDVRDVAQAHVQAILNPQAKGRYIVVAEPLRLLEMAKLMDVQKFGLKDRLPRSEAPKALIWLIAPWIGMQRQYVARNVGYPIHFDNQRSCTELGLHYYRPEQTLNDHIQQIFTDGLAHP